MTDITVTISNDYIQSSTLRLYVLFWQPNMGYTSFTLRNTIHILLYRLTPYAGQRIGEAAHPGPPALDRALHLLGLDPGMQITVRFKPHGCCSTFAPYLD